MTESAVRQSAIRRGPRWNPEAGRREGGGVSVVIPTLNGGERFGVLLEALAGQDVEGGLELVVIDSGSTDGTWERAVDAGAHVERIPKSEFNHGATRNLGISRTSGEFIALITQDAVPMSASTVRHLVQPFHDDASIDGVYARQFPLPDCDPILKERLRRWSASRDERVIQTLVPGDPEASRTLFDELEPMERYLRCAFDNVTSAVRRSSWERIPLPPRPFGEDVAWARATLLSGGSVCFQPDAEVEHSHPIEMSREFQRLYCDHRNLIELFGLRNVPSWGHALRGWKGQRRFYAELLAGLDLPKHEHLGWRLYSIPYSLAEGVAQFLGARSHWKTEQSRFWHWFDGRMRA